MNQMPRQVGARKALIVEDEPHIRELLRLHLGAAGFDVEECVEGTGALRLLRTEVFDLIVLDVMLPGLDGVSVCRGVRREGVNASSPILMVTARDAESDKVLGLESGADDYIAKPFGIREFLARVAAVTRRHGQRPEGALEEASLSEGPVVIDVRRRLVTVRDQPVTLTRQEFELLHKLASRRGIVFSRTALLNSVWKDDGYVTERTVDGVISRLRRKIEVDPKDPELILTAWGVGYRFNDLD